MDRRKGVDRNTGVDLLRVPEVESELAILNRMLEEDEYQSDEFRKRLSFGRNNRIFRSGFSPYSDGSYT